MNDDSILNKSDDEEGAEPVKEEDEETDGAGVEEAAAEPESEDPSDDITAEDEVDEI